jgi:very-short-patch-repair endonuclease
VEDRKNCLILEFSSKHNERIIASIQAALKNAIQNCFELESSELAVEPLPDHNNRRSILFYEASEGGAGVLRKLVDDCDALPKVARIALELCHFNPDTGADLRHAPKSKENCEAACYDCLMSYTNQTDRQLIKELLLDMVNSNIESSPASKSRARHLQELMNLTGSKLECDWLQFLESRNLRLPSHAQSLIEVCQTRPDFVYREQQVAVYVDGPPHDYPERKQRDQNQTNCMEDIGWTVIRFNVSEDWDQIIRRYPNIFGVYK